MQNKKLLSTLLVLVMICACAFGMLVTRAGAEMTAEPIEWLGDFASTIESIDGATFDGTKYAEITIPAGETVAATEANDVLFGVETIFDANGARLPIVIKGEDDTATITFEDVKGDVSCSNSYTFQGLNFFIADAAEQINFYAGSGEVVLDTVVLSADGTGKNAYFYADNAAAAAFAGWTAPAEGDLIATSLTFKNTNYTQADWNAGGTTANGAACKGQVGVVGAAADFANAEVTEITAAMTGATLKIEDSKLSGVWLRKTTAVSPVSEVNFIVNDSSDTGIANTSLGGIIGVGVSSTNDGGANKAGPWELGNFNYNVTINGGTISGRVVFFRGAVFTGDMNLTINGGKFGNEVYIAYGDGVKTGVIFGKVTATINDGDFANTVFGSNAAASCFDEENTITEVDKIDNLTTINGGTFKTFQGNRVAGSVHTVVKGGTITTYHGSYSTGSGGGVYDLVVNTIDGGTITTFYGSGFNKHLDSGKPGVAGYSIPQLINNFNGGTITTAYGAGTPKFVENLTNNFNGTAFTTVYGTYFADYTDKGYEGFGGTKVTGTLTNNVNVVTWAAGTSKVDAFRPIGYSIAGDFVLNLNCAQAKFAGFASNAFENAEVSVKNFTLNATGVSGWGGETFLNDLHATGDATFNFTNCANNSHLVALYGGKVDGDLNVNVDTFNFSSTTKHRFFLIYDPLVAAVTSTKDAIGGDINLVMKKLTNVKSKANKDAQRLVIAGRRDSGKIASYPVIENDVNLTFEDTTLLSWAGNSSEINGTFAVTYKGTNKFANDAFPSNAARVNKQVNNIAGTITSDFYGAGAPVGTWVEVPAVEEGAEPTLEFVPGEIENNILPGAAIKAKFFGSGSETVKSVTNTMTGGSVSSASGADANVELSIGCYYGNFGPVTDKVVNNIYSGGIGNNMYGSNGDLECEIYTNIGNELYAELYPEAEALAKPTFGRLTFAGGRYFTTENVTSVDPETQEEVTTTVKNYAFDAKTGNTGPVYVNVNGAQLGMVNWIYGGLHIADEEGFVGKFDIKNANFTTFTYFNINPETECIEGNVSISLDGVTQPAKKGWFGPSKMHGDLTWNIKNSEFKSFVLLTIGDVYGNMNVSMDNVINHTTFTYTANWSTGDQSEYYANEKNERPKTVYELSLVANVKNTNFIDFRDIGGSGSTTLGVTGSLTEHYENCVFAGGTTQFVNRDTRGECLFTFDSCSFESSITQGMRPNGGNNVYVYGDTVIGTPADVEAGTEAVGEVFYGVRYDTLTHIGAKPDAEGNAVAAETTLTMHGDSRLVAIRDAAETNAAYGLKFYDVTVAGTGIIAPNLDADANTEGWQQGTTAPQVILAGNLNVAAESPEIYISNVEGANATVSAVDGNWIAGKTYVTVLAEGAIDNISGRSIGIANGYAKKVDNTLVGAAFAGQGAVSLDVGERIVVKLWLLKDDVDAYLANGMKNTAGENAFEYWGSIDLDPATAGADKYLGEGVITAADLDSLELSADGNFYKVDLGAVSADNFDKKIELAGSTFALNAVGEAPITILNLAKAGIDDPANASNISALNLFKAIYNYGASVLGEEMYTMDGFVQTGAAAPVYQKGSADDIAFTSMSLLMGDAIGIRFKGTVVDPETVVTLTVNGEKTNSFKFDEEAGILDVYVNLAKVEEELTFIIYTDGAPAIAVKTSIKGYTEAVMNKGDAELAVAQLAQACANILGK